MATTAFPIIVNEDDLRPIDNILNRRRYSMRETMLTQADKRTIKYKKRSLCSRLGDG